MKWLGQSRNDAHLLICVVVKVKSDVRKEQYCIRPWNIKSTNHSKLDVVKHKIARVNIDILGISELKWMGMGKFKTIISTPLEEME